MSMSLNLKGFENLRAELDTEINKAINTVQRANAFAATSELALVTPVDTGRARSSWVLSNSNITLDNTSNPSAGANFLLGPIPSDRIETLYITNGTPYIQDLNAGSSLQAPPRFVEKTLAKYFKSNGSFAKVIK